MLQSLRKRLKIFKFFWIILNFHFKFFAKIFKLLMGFEVNIILILQLYLLIQSLIDRSRAGSPIICICHGISENWWVQVHLVYIDWRDIINTIWILLGALKRFQWILQKSAWLSVLLSELLLLFVIKVFYFIVWII